ncbi:ribosomal large subunit pseudouridine synthase D [Sphaerotilus hippei]|uniref:Pseudouridine synthase n=1 Tax=Sphaerotilus hippei TaxID=744406 RepID=A0A318H490_9BURK|nr:RluA family pseudouridine synthase [Sphaerotilus hippei]PXW98622.1 ribosomal large subunit pseudouridine synthase D [Sphaerotilus hippei]
MNRSPGVPPEFPAELEDTEEGVDPGGGLAEGGEPETRTATVDAAAHGLRLDRWLVGVAPEFSRSHLQTLIEAGHVRCAGQVLASASRKVTAGQVIAVVLQPTAHSTAFRPEPMALDVVHEDAALLVLHKPAGLVVHPAAGHWSGTLLNGLLAHHAAAAGLPRAGIVHRLDKDTSGLMVVAKTLEAQTALVRAIAAREVRREYLALIHGRPAWSVHTLEAAIGRDPVSRVRMAVVASGKPARTDVRVLAVATPEGGRASVAAVHCKLHTGRTHQIRVHLSQAGHPLLADAVYGGKPVLGLQRQALHAARLSLHHPVTGAWMVFEAPLPDDLAQAWASMAGDQASVFAAFGYNDGQCTPAVR